MLDYILFVISLCILVKGAEFLVDGASSFAKKIGVSSLVIGLTVVAFGTSMPEMMVNVFAALNGQTGIGFGNIFGSNIVNILLIIGVVALINPFKVKYQTMWREIPFVILSVFILFVMVNDSLFDGGVSMLSRTDGIVMLALFFIFIYYLAWTCKSDGDNPNIKEMTICRSIVFIVAGIILLIIGGKFTIDCSVRIMESLHISGEMIGLTMIAIGTSLPELVTAIVAATKKHTDLLIGNLLGSNIFNILFVLGLTAFIHPMVYNISLNFDIIISMIAAYMLFAIMFTGKKKKMIEKWEGATLLAAYCIYLISIFYRLGFLAW